jgi:hypothetical protein
MGKAPKSKKAKFWRIFLFSFLGFFVALFSGFFIYSAIYYHAEDVSAYLQSDDSLSVKQEKNISFLPKKASSSALVFYPGAKVEFTSYAPLCYLLAKQDFTVYLVKMPFNLAFFDIDAAESIRSTNPAISHWYLAGHSLGGAMAASCVHAHLEHYTGLFLLASYSTDDLSKSALATMTLYGSEDQVLNKANYDKNLAHLPSSNEEHVLVGGNHSGFAFYGPQKGDGEATLSKIEQINLTVSYLAGRMIK